MNDEHLVALSYEIDDELAKLMSKYRVSPLSLSSIIVARLIRLTQETCDVDDFRSILEIAISKQDVKKVYQ